MNSALCLVWRKGDSSDPVFYAISLPNEALIRPASCLQSYCAGSLVLVWNSWSFRKRGLDLFKDNDYIWILPKNGQRGNCSASFAGQT